MVYKVVNKILLTTARTKHKRHELNPMERWRELPSMNSRGEPQWEPTSTICVISVWQPDKLQTADIKWNYLQHISQSQPGVE